MRHLPNVARCRTSILIAMAAIGIVSATANGAVNVIGTTYQQDNPYTEFQCIWHDANYPTSCGNTVTGSNVHVYLKNTGVSSVTISDATLAGYSLATVIKKSTLYHDAYSIYFYWDNPPQAILDAGEPVWFRATPKTIPAGGVGRVVIRLRSVPTTATVTVGVVHTAGTTTATITKDAAAPQVANVSFSLDRTKVYLHWRRSGGAGPTTVKMDDTDVTASCTTVSDANLDFAITKLSLGSALTQGSWHVYQGIYSDGTKATACMKTWSREFTYATWYTFTIPDGNTNAAKAWINSCADRGINAVENQMSGGLGDLLATSAGRDYATSKGYGVIKWNKDTNGDTVMWFLDDEPDAEEDNLACGNGLMLPCGSGHDTGVLVMKNLGIADTMLAEDSVPPTTVNMDATLKPDNYYSYGQAVDCLSADPYYQARMRDGIYDNNDIIPLYRQSRDYIYGVSSATRSAAEPNPSYIILYSTKNVDNQAFPYPTRESKRQEFYYSLAAGSKGISYWWFKTPNGLGSEEPDALELWDEMGLLGGEAKTVSQQIVNSHPAPITIATSDGVWAKATASGLDTMILYVVTEDYYNDIDGCHYTPVGNATVTATLPSWMTSSPTAFEVTSDGISDIGTSLNGSQMKLILGTLNLTRMIVITTNANLRSTIETHYTNNVRPGICNFEAAHCTPLNTTPKIIMQPTGAAVFIGDSADFAVSAVGSPTITYQWQKNGVNIAGATTTALQKSNIQAGDTGTYRCKVTNSYGSVYSNNAQLSVLLSDECVVNSDAEGGFSLQGGGYIANGWTEWESVSGTTTGYDETITVHGGDHAQRIRIYDTGGTSGGVYQQMPATVNDVYAVTSYMYAQYAITNCYLGVDRTGGTNPASGNVTWSSAVNSQSWVQRSVTVTAAASNITIFYKVVAGDAGKHNGYFDDTTPYCQTVSSPSITQQPVNTEAAVGGSASFTVVAEGTTPLSYQWKKNGTNVAGGTSATLQLTNIQTGDAGNYTCVVSNAYGSDTSSAATLTVTVCGSLTNGNFEAGTVGNPPSGWATYIQSAKSGAFTIQTVSPPQGTLYQQTQMFNTGSYGGIRQNITGLTSGGVYTISGTYKTNSTSATASVRYNLSANTDRTSSTVLVSKSTTSWGTFSGNVTASGTSLTLFLDHLNGTSTNKASTFDNIRIACAAPTITQQPSAQTACTGTTATFTVTATGGGLSYQWQKAQANLSNGGHYSGVTTATLTISSADTNDAANYRCVVTNPGGSVNSNEASLTIRAATIVTTQPIAQNICSGVNVSFSVAATGYGTPTYQWQKSSVNITNGGHYSGATTATLTITGADGTDEAGYRCVVTAGCGSVNSNTAVLTIKAPASITDQPDASEICPGENASFSITAEGDGTVTYQWQKNSVNVADGGHYSGCTTPTMTVTGADTNDAANYRCKVVADCGSATSNQAALTISSGVDITGHPSPVSICPGSNASFYVGATGPGTLTYQWQKNSANVADGGHYSGCTTASMTVTGADTNDAANYRCVIGSDCGSGTSNQAALTLNGAGALTNGNFEYSTVGNPPYGWTTYIQATKSGAWTIQTVSPPQGTRYQQTQVFNTGSFGGVRQNVTGLTSGAVYTISGTYRTNSTSATSAVRYNLSGNTDRANSTVLVSKTNTNWGTFSADVTATGSSLMLFLDHLNGAYTNKASAFDNIKVTCKP